MASGSSFDKRNEQALDLISSVRLLQGLGSEDLGKLFVEPGNIASLTTSNGILVHIDMEKLSRNLALHICGASLAWKREKSSFEYLLSAVRLLHSLYDLASKHPTVKQILLDDVKVAEELIDLAFYLMVILCSSFMQEKGGLVDLALLHSTMVACTLYLLRACTSSQWHDLSQVLLAYYKVDVFMDAAFAAVRLNIKFLGAKISSVDAGSHVDSIHKTEEMLNYLCQQCEASMQFLQSLCQQKAFRERLVKNKELCSKGGIILLAQAILSLQISPCLENLSSLMAGVSRLKSRMLSILLHLCEAESVSYLDEVAGTPKSMELTKSIVLEVLALLRRMFNRDFKQTSACSQKIYPTGQLQLNAMRLVDIFSDDSNFRSFITIHFTELLTDIFMLPHGEFLSSWCSSDLSVWEEEAIVTYDPFSAAGWVLSSCSSAVSGKPLNSEYIVSSSLSQASYAHERTALLVKAIANLHCFVPDICKEEKDLFLTKFLQCLQREPSKLSDEFSSISDVEKAAIVCKNLGSLLGHAESLIPGFLNEEDVQLLRVFIRQLELHISPRGGNHKVQEAQITEGGSSALSRDVAPIFSNGIRNIESISRNYSLPEGIHFNINSDTGQSKDFVRQEIINYRSAAGYSAKAETDTQNVETSGDSSSTREKTYANQNYYVYSKQEGAVEAQRPEKVSMHQEERQHRKRKRTIMNEEQIALVEKAIVDEPRLHRNASSLKLWAQRLSDHGPEVTTSQLKNWLNNRKARLARAAKDARVLSEGDNPDKHMGDFNVPSHETSISPVDDLCVASTAEGKPENGADCTIRVHTNETSVIEPKMTNALYSTGELQYEPQQSEVLVNEKAEIIENGEVHHVLDQSKSENLESQPCS